MPGRSAHRATRVGRSTLAASRNGHCHNAVSVAKPELSFSLLCCTVCVWLALEQKQDRRGRPFVWPGRHGCRNATAARSVLLALARRHSTSAPGTWLAGYGNHDDSHKWAPTDCRCPPIVRRPWIRRGADCCDFSTQYIALNQRLQRSARRVANRPTRREKGRCKSHKDNARLDLL